MAEFVISAKELGRAIEQDVEKLRASLVQTIRTTVKLHAPRIAQELVANENPPPVDRGTYRRSFKVGDIENGAVLYNFAPYAAVIESGRRPGGRMPPVDAIEAWVRRKKIGVQRGPVGRRYGNVRGLRMQRSAIRSRGLSKGQARGIAFVIARAIARRGLPAHHILARAVARLEPIVAEALASAVEKL